MTVRWIFILSAGALVVSTIGSHAGPCSDEIARMQARIDAKLKAKAAAGPMAPESSGALLTDSQHRVRSRQPKVGSAMYRHRLSKRWSRRWRARAPRTVLAIRAP